MVRRHKEEGGPKGGDWSSPSLDLDEIELLGLIPREGQGGRGRGVRCEGRGNRRRKRGEERGGRGEGRGNK